MKKHVEIFLQGVLILLILSIPKTFSMVSTNGSLVEKIITSSNSIFVTFTGFYDEAVFQSVSRNYQTYTIDGMEHIGFGLGNWSPGNGKLHIVGNTTNYAFSPLQMGTGDESFLILNDFDENSLSKYPRNSLFVKENKAFRRQLGIKGKILYIITYHSEG